MDKEKILEKARRENKGKDLIEKEVERQAGPYILNLLIVIYVVLVIVQMITGKHEESIHILAWGVICGKSIADYKVKKEEKSFWYMLSCFGILLVRLYSYIRYYLL